MGGQPVFDGLFRRGASAPPGHPVHDLADASGRGAAQAIDLPGEGMTA